MKLEENLAKTDLFKYVKSPRERFVIEALKYRNYKTNVALDKMREVWKDMFQKLTASFYYNEIRRYYETGTSILSFDYKALVDKHRDIEALPIDKESHARKIQKKKNASDIDVPVIKKQNIVTSLKVATDEVVEKFLYGIKFNGCCTMTFQNENEQKMFLKGLEMSSIIKDYKKVHVKSDAITEVE